MLWESQEEANRMEGVPDFEYLSIPPTKKWRNGRNVCGGIWDGSNRNEVVA